MWSKIILISLFGFSGMLTSTFDIRGIVSGDRMASVPLGVSLGAGELDVEGICTAPGMACQNCSLAITCIPLPSGWLKLPLEECGSGYTCNAHLGKCSLDPVPECDARSQEFQHSCEQVGIFPDAYDCRKFHLCSPPEGMPDGRPADHRSALCPRHYGYNPQTAQCSIPLLHGQCKEMVTPNCNRAGEFSALPSSPNHYYVCLARYGTLQPQIFICPNGWYFWDGFCRTEPKPELPVQQKPAFDANSLEPQTCPNGWYFMDGFCRLEPKPVQPKPALDSKSSESKEMNSEETVKTTEPIMDVLTEPSSTEKSTSRIDSFFSTEKAATFAADTFLADKFDLANYESTDDVVPANSDYPNHYDDWNTFDK